jgi:hypothetical protein
MGGLYSHAWVELAVLAPGRSHQWAFDPQWDAHGWVFQATAHPEPCPDGDMQAGQGRRVEVTELFVIQRGDKAPAGWGASQINITVTNSGDLWTSYTLWVAGIPSMQ